jgi:hypothetical protein
MVPEAVAKRINAQGLSAQEDRDNFDYFYRLEDIVRLAGGQYKQKRNKANSVRRILAEHMTTTRTSEVDDRTAEEILELYDLWSATS